MKGRRRVEGKDEGKDRWMRLRMEVKRKDGRNAEGMKGRRKDEEVKGGKEGRMKGSIEGRKEGKCGNLNVLVRIKSLNWWMEGLWREVWWGGEVEGRVEGRDGGKRWREGVVLNALIV